MNKLHHFIENLFLTLKLMLHLHNAMKHGPAFDEEPHFYKKQAFDYQWRREQVRNYA